MYLGVQFPTPQREDESICFGIFTLSEGICSVYQAHTQTFPQKRAGHHQEIRWWCHTSYDDILVTWEISDDNIYVSTEGVWKEECVGERGFQVKSS